jgi:hypothetical protein
LEKDLELLKKKKDQEQYIKDREVMGVHASKLNKLTTPSEFFSTPLADKNSEVETQLS